MSDISCRDINERTCRGGLNEYYDEDQDDLTFKNKEMCEAEKVVRIVFIEFIFTVIYNKHNLTFTIVIIAKSITKRKIEKTSR